MGTKTPQIIDFYKEQTIKEINLLLRNYADEIYAYEFLKAMRRRFCPESEKGSG